MYQGFFLIGSIYYTVGSVGRVFRPEKAQFLLRRATRGGSVGRGQTESGLPKSGNVGRSAGTFSPLKTSRRHRRLRSRAASGTERGGVQLLVHNGRPLNGDGHHSKEMGTATSPSFCTIYIYIYRERERGKCIHIERGMPTSTS